MNGLMSPRDAMRLFLRALPDPHLPKRGRVAGPARNRVVADAGSRSLGRAAGLAAPRHPEILVKRRASVRRLVAAARVSTAVVAN